MSAFPPIVLQAFAEKREVEVETRSKAGEVHKVIIWIVVVDDVPYVRSVRGPRGRWFRELLARGDGAVHVGARRIPVRAKAVKDEVLHARVSDAISTKYKTSKASVIAMLRPETLATTARLEPA